MKKITIIDPRIRPKPADLIDPPIIIRLSKFNDDGAKEFSLEMEKAHNTGQPVIPIVVDSYGGSVYSLIDMISQILTSKLPVITITEGKAMSAGAMLFAMGKYRYMAPNAVLMLHDVSSFTWGKVEELKADVKQTEYLQKHIFGLISKNVSRPKNYFTKIIHDLGHTEWYLTAEAAAKHSLCTHIGVPDLNIKVSLSYQFGTLLF